MIGIVTQPLGYNYGGILQNYALQKVLQNLGYDSITLDNSYKYSYTRYVVSSVISLLSVFLGKKRPFPRKPYLGRSIPKVTATFIRHNIHLTSPCNGFSQQTLLKYNINTIIVGSDQVWRPIYNKSIFNMFLDFAPKECKKLSYAASFGTNKWEYNKQETLKCKQLLKQFIAVSVREKSGIELTTKHLDFPNVELVLDPTLLLSKQDYLSLCENIPSSTSKFLCAYILDLTKEKEYIVHSIAKSKNLEVKIFSADDKLVLSIEEWISNFRDASFVITDSFHGTVFSIIFERDFIVLQNDERGEERFNSLLSNLNLRNRIYNNLSFCNECVDWDTINNTLCVLREKSISYLKKNL